MVFYLIRGKFLIDVLYPIQLVYADKLIKLELLTFKILVIIFVIFQKKIKTDMETFDPKQCIKCTIKLVLFLFLNNQVVS